MGISIGSVGAATLIKNNKRARRAVPLPDPRNEVERGARLVEIREQLAVKEGELATAQQQLSEVSATTSGSGTAGGEEVTEAEKMARAMYRARVNEQAIRVGASIGSLKEELAALESEKVEETRDRVELELRSAEQREGTLAKRASSREARLGDILRNDEFAVRHAVDISKVQMLPHQHWNPGRIRSWRRPPSCRRRLARSHGHGPTIVLGKCERSARDLARRLYLRQAGRSHWEQAWIGR